VKFYKIMYMGSSTFDTWYCCFVKHFMLVTSLVLSTMEIFQCYSSSPSRKSVYA
jgi:hypothetical protein